MAISSRERRAICGIRFTSEIACIFAPRPTQSGTTSSSAPRSSSEPPADLPFRFRAGSMRPMAVSPAYFPDRSIPTSWSNSPGRSSWARAAISAFAGLTAYSEPPTALRSRPSRRGPPWRAPWRKRPRVTSGAAVETDGIRRLVSYRTVAGYPLVITIGEAEANIFQNANRQALIYFGIAMALTLVTAFFIVAIIQRQSTLEAQ